MTPSDYTLRAVLRRQRAEAAMVGVVALLAGVNWILNPMQAERWLLAMLTLPLAFVALAWWQFWVLRSRRPTGRDDVLAIQRYFRAALALVVLAVGTWQVARLGLEIWGRLGDHRADLETERRVLGLATGTMFIVIGNALPKILTPLSMLPVHLADRVTRARRVIGTTWVVLGLIMLWFFLAMPLPVASPLARWSALAALITVLGAIIWMNTGPGRQTE